MNIITISVTHSHIESGKVIFQEIRKFSKDSESIEYLKQIEKDKMQRLFHVFKLGKYTVGRLVNSNLYWKAMNANNIKTKVEVTTERVNESIPLFDVKM